MTKDQVAMLRDANLKDDGTGQPKASVFTTVFNDEICFRNTDDFVIFDDANELVHAIKINQDGPRSAAALPYKICTGFYGNIQFMEGLYTMSNLEKMVDELFVNTGLIDDKKKKMIMAWAGSVRNHSQVPMHPGPYYKDTPQIVPKPPVPEVRDDGLFHAAPLDQRTKVNKIIAIVDPLIPSIAGEVSQRRRQCYDVKVAQQDAFAESIKNIIATLEDDDLFYATFTNGKTAAIYNPGVPSSKSSFVDNAVEFVIPKKKGQVAELHLYLEAYGVRVDYVFYVHVVNDDAADEKWMNETELSINTFISEINSSAISQITYGTAREVDAVINTTDGLDIGLTQFLASLPDASKVTWKLGGKSVTLTVGNETSYEEFKKGVLASMPTEQNQTLTGEATVESVNQASLVYTLKVKYYNEAKMACTIGGVYYPTLALAIAAVQDGVETEIVLNKDVTENIVVPEGKIIVLNLNGKTLANAEADHTILNNGTMTITGGGTVDNTVHAKAAVKNMGTMTVLSAALTRSAEAGVDKDNNGGNSFYVVANEGDITFGSADGDNSGVSVTALGKFSSLVVNGWYDNSDGKTAENDTCHMVIHGGTFTGGLNTIKADELSDLTINGGTFVNYAQHSLLNWNHAVINGGTFTAENLPVICNGKFNDTTAIGDLTINGGTFESGTADVFMLFKGYESDLIKVYGGTFSSDPSTYVAAGYEAVVNTEGKYVVSEKSAEQKVEDVLNGASTEDVTITADETEANTYSITTSSGSIASTGIFEDLAAIDGMTSIVVTDGDTTVTYNAGEDIEAFKASVDALVPQDNTDAEVTLTMTVNVG